MPSALSYELHLLTARLDRTADGLLRRQEGVSYPRFLALFAVSEGATSQRELATSLRQSEPSTSRMVGVLVNEALLKADRTAGAGNRRRLTLTDAGAELVERCAHLLERRFEDLVAHSGVSYLSYQRTTRRLLDQIDTDLQETRKSEGAA